MNINELKSISTISERAQAKQLGVSRTTLRAWKSKRQRMNLGTIERLFASEGRAIEVLSYPISESAASESSIAVISMKIKLEGFSSWKIHLFEFVDELRRTKDARLIALAPCSGLDPKLVALLSSTVLELCHELKLSPPGWARCAHFLPQPWFVADTESLKATAILESPTRFRRNNIFVLENFLARI